MTPFEQQKKFLDLVREGSGYLAYKPIDGKFKQCWFTDTEHALDIIDRQHSTCDIWVSMATFPDKRLTREADNASALFSFWIDVDAHQDSRYKSPEETELAVDNFVQSLGLPKPTLVHRTGYGVHILWALKDGLPLDEWSRIASKLQALFEPLNIEADTITADAARILRVPGTRNFRHKDYPVDAEMTVLTEELIDPDLFESILDSAILKYPPKQKIQSSKFQTTISTLQPTKLNIQRVKDMLDCIDPDPKGHGGGNRSKWMRVVWSLAATGWGVTAYDLAREWSEGGDLFDEDDFQGVWDSYDPQWTSGGSKSGVSFGTLVHYAREAGYTGLLPDQDEPHKPNNTNASLASGQLLLSRASDIKPEPVNWLVKGSIPLGSMAVIGGQPGLGKSQIAISLAAAVTTGKGLPNGETFSDIGSVIILANEDDAARTIRPRLDAAGADTTRVHIVEGIAREGQADADLFQLDTDIRELRITAQLLGDVRLIIIDPPSAYLGTKVDSYKDSDVRRVLTPLGALAQETGALIVLVVHLNKRTDGGAQQRIGGSTAWVAAPRVAFLVVEDPKTKERFMLPVKNNLGDDRTGFQYRIVEKLLNYDEQMIKAPYIEWLSSTQRSALDLLASPKLEHTSVVDDAKTFLEDELTVSSKKVSELKESAKSAGISWASIQRAKKDLFIMTKKMSDGWQWTLKSGDKNV
jgi:putative DNA primase/helicase